MGTEKSDSNVRMLFFPFMAQGHLLPMLSMANIFAARGVHSTLLTTPANAASLNIPSSTTNIHLHLIPFPSPDDTGLPEGCENVSSLPQLTLVPKFFTATALLRDAFAASLSLLRPDCVVTDMFFPWTYTVAAEAGVPRLVFHGTSVLNLAAFESLHQYKTLENLAPGDETFVVPGVPRGIEMHRSQLPDFKRPRNPVFLEIERQRHEVEPRSFGVLFNSFYELESEYADYYRNVLGRKAWLVGPISLSSPPLSARMEAGDVCLEWLEQHRSTPGSVLYICFGSVSLFNNQQLRQIALALEACSHPFVWVVRKGGDDWVPEGFEERIEGRGLVVRGWAPQTQILNHETVGGFLTHCGWNSSLEGISASLPMVTWPLFADQFYNEKLIVDALGIGVAIGAKENETIPDQRTVVEAEKIREAVDCVMGKGEDAEGRRRRARELGEKAKRAVREGGSSYTDVGNLIQVLVDRKSKSEEN